MEFLCHDIKTERREVSGGLPQGLKIIPVLFYFALAACLSLYVWFEMNRSAAERDAVKWRAAAGKFNGDVASVAQERKSIESANTWATNVSKWLEGSHNLQPLLVELGRGVGGDASIAEASFMRNAEIASQIQFSLKMNGVSNQILDRTLEGIRKLDFRAYSAQQQKEGEALDYNAILVYQKSDEAVPRQNGSPKAK
jgi:hypothetical protein